jgi:hypothetical protein
MKLVDFAQVRASLADKALVGFETGVGRDLGKAGTTKCGLIKSTEAKRGILKVNATKRGPKPSPVTA